MEDKKIVNVKVNIGLDDKEVRIKHKTKNLILDHYHCTLFLPLTGLEKTDFTPNHIERQYYCHDSKLESGEAAGYYYFSPTIRNILYDCPKNLHTLKAIKEWRLSNDIIDKWELHLGRIKYNCDYSKYQKSKVISVRLLQYFNGLYLLAIRLKPLALHQLKKKGKTDTLYNATQNNLDYFTHKDKENTQQYQQLIMEDWMHFSRLIRLIYPSFEQQTDENKIAPIHLYVDGTGTGTEKASAYDYKQVKKETEITIPKNAGENFNPVILEFIKAFAEKPNDVEEQVKNHVEFYDDRMFISVAYGIAGKKALPANSLEGINTLVSHIDRQETDGYDDLEGGYAYTPHIIRDKTKKQAFSLWEGLGSYYTFTDFSNTYLSTGGDFRNYIAPDHIPHIYDRMLIQALFYQATLRHYDNQICDTTKELLEYPDIEKIKKQRREFIRFTNQYWFHKLTEQMQGKEIFTLQQKALGLQEHYNILKDELERTDEYLQTVHEINENKFNSRVGFYGLLLALTAIYYSILPVLENFVKAENMTLWKRISNWLKGQDMEIATEQIAFVATLTVPPILLYLAIKFIIWLKK